MENSIRFRNHISVVFEKIGALNGVLFFFLLTNFEVVEEFVKDGNFKDLKRFFWIGGGVLVLYLCTALYQLVMWSKTVIVISDQSIVLEKNTLNKTRLTIGIKNISNVNIERNLFEMLIGTCKVKMDTNSMSTAESTDVSIVLKYKDGEEFRSHILQLMKLAEGEAEHIGSVEYTMEEEWDYQANLSEIIRHGFFSISLFSVVMMVIGFLMVLGVLKTYFFEADKMEFVALLGGLLMSGGLFISSFSSIAKGFVRYYDFRIARRENKLYIQYGFFKKMNYMIPVEKINGLIVEQSCVARVCKHYKGTLINIGMGDDAIEAESFLFPYCKENLMKERIELFLPELKNVVAMNYEKQPRETWLAWSLPFCVFSGVMIVGGWIGNQYFPEYRLWIILGVALLIFIAVLNMILYYITDGIQIGGEYLLLVSGAFVKKYCFISCRKIQYLSFKQNPIARMMKLQKGQAFILASFIHRAQMIPYVSEEKVRLLKESILNRN